MKTLVLGASYKPSRYSFLAVNMLREYDHEVIAVGRRFRELDGWTIEEGKPNVDEVDTITLYMNAKNQKEYYEYIFGLKPNRVIFNPGTENEELEYALRGKGVEVLRACTLVMLRTEQY